MRSRTLRSCAHDRPRGATALASRAGLDVPADGCGNRKRALEYWDCPISHHYTITPLLHYSVTPLLLYSSTPLLLCSTTPLLNHSVSAHCSVKNFCRIRSSG